MNNTWNQENVISISESVIKMAIATKEHPHTVLMRMMKLAETFDLEDVEGMTSACRKVIKSKQSELPFTFDEPYVCVNCTMVYSDILYICPNCGHDRRNTYET